MTTSVWGEGFDAYQQGVADTDCPYTEPVDRSEWLAGWDAAEYTDVQGALIREAKCSTS